MKEVIKASRIILDNTKFKGDIAIILGSGLGGFTDALENKKNKVQSCRNISFFFNFASIFKKCPRQVYHYQIQKLRFRGKTRRRHRQIKHYQLSTQFQKKT